MSVDLEKLISESKERLGKHKEYLEKTAQRGSGTSGSDHANVPSSPPRTYSPARFAATSPPQTGGRPAGSGAAAASRPSPAVASSYQQQQQQQRPPHDEFQRGSGNPDSPSYSGYNPYSSNVARAGHDNFGNPHGFYEGSPGGDNSSKRQRPGFYLSGRPLTKVYERGQKFVGSRESFLEKQRQESWEKEMHECTFSPFVSKRAARAQGRAVAQAGAAAQQQQPKSPSPSGSQPRGGLGDKTLLDWCVESDRSNVGFHVDAPSVFLHIQRQQDARKAKADGESKLMIDTTQWAPKLTEPKEFNFGRSDQPIRALRKPMLQMVRLSSGEDGSRPGSISPGRRGANTPARAAARASKSPQKRSGSQHVVGDEDAEIEARRAEQHKKFVEVSNVANEQKAQIAHQSEEIAKLNGLIQSLKMESEAAKAKVREMALSQTIAGQK